MTTETPGVRVQPNDDGYLDPREIDQPARYGRTITSRVDGTRAGWWQVTAPDRSIGCLDPQVHIVTEHEDGTITVTPSIDFSKRKPGGWHGWLTRGVFRSV